MATNGKFTDRGIASLKPEAKRRVVWEAAAHGQGNVGMRIFPSGVKSWIYMYRHDGTARMLTLGNYPMMSVADAHAAAAKATLDHAHGLDPASKVVQERHADRETPTVQSLADKYVELYASQKKSGDRDAALLARNVLPHWGTRKANDISRGDVALLMDKIQLRGALIQANRTHSVISRMYNWAVEREMVEKNPVIGYRAPVKEKPRERCLTDEELGRFLSRLDLTRLALATRLALRFQVLTACRPGEAAGARWSEIDLDAAIWRLPSERTKNAMAHALPLSPQALEVLRHAKTLDRGAGVCFPSPQHSKGKPIHGMSMAHGVQDNLKLFEVEPFHPHDLRRTAATGIAELGADWTVLQKILNHKLRGETAKYVRHGYAAEMRAVLELWGVKVAELTRAGSRNGAVNAEK